MLGNLGEAFTVLTGPIVQNASFCFATFVYGQTCEKITSVFIVPISTRKWHDDRGEQQRVVAVEIVIFFFMKMKIYVCVCVTLFMNMCACTCHDVCTFIKSTNAPSSVCKWGLQRECVLMHRCVCVCVYVWGLLLAIHADRCRVVSARCSSDRVETWRRKGESPGHTTARLSPALHTHTHAPSPEGLRVCVLYSVTAWWGEWSLFPSLSPIFSLLINLHTHSTHTHMLWR